MKLEFEDGSFLDVLVQEKSVCIVMCGKHGNKLTMSSASLNQQQVKDLIQILQKQIQHEQ